MSKTSSARSVALATAIALSLSLSAAVARADESAESPGASAGMQIGALGCTLLYGPAKLVYAGLGSVVSGLAWALTGGDTDVARPIFAASAYGDYIVTPQHLTGDRPLEFVGRDTAAGGPQDVAGPAADKGTTDDTF